MKIDPREHFGILRLQRDEHPMDAQAGRPVVDWNQGQGKFRVRFKVPSVALCLPEVVDERGTQHM
jgi:hypothetical protein